MAILSTMFVPLAVNFGIQWGMWAVSSVLKTEKFYDLTGSITFLYIAVSSLLTIRPFHTRSSIQAGCVIIWALRLGSFLFSRVLKEGKDRRFDGVRDKPGRFLVFWTLQGVWVAITILPSLLTFSRPSQRLNMRDYLGWSLWAVGFVIEVVADRQKSQFRSQPVNEGRFVNVGLWAISRHPNYFGEILMWFALAIPATNCMSGWQFLSLLCPLFDALLITKLSGIPLLEKQANRRWGEDPTYQQYVSRTAQLIPFLW